jgi:hypothetical protein
VTPGIRRRRRKDGSVTSRLAAPRGPYTYRGGGGSPLHGTFRWGGDVADQAASMLQSWSDLLVT